MLFNSLEFALFFPLVTALYYLLPHRLRWAMLLLASCLFYMAFVPAYILILALTIIIDYWAGIKIEASTGQNRRVWLVLSILSTCLVLFVFKYFNFFADSLNGAAHFLHWNYSLPALSLILPIGLSFHTFQSLSYVVEVYRGQQRAERHFGIYALYVMFYPQLVAGPIERPQNLLHQFWEAHPFDYAGFTAGLKLMGWGLFKKVVIADRLAILVSQVYGDPQSYPGLGLILATVFFAFQIYCDFSGYSDIARGAAQTMGFRLMLNFDRPYTARSVAEFWKRWHISLSTWFKDYLYISLGGNRVSYWRWQLNLFLTFLVSGLWHGANWTFVVWGGLNGLYLVLENLTAGLRRKIAVRSGLTRHPRLLAALQTLFTFCLICLAWIFFRAESVADGWFIFSHLGSGWQGWLQLPYWQQTLLSLGMDPSELRISFLAILALLAADSYTKKYPGQVRWPQPVWLRWGLYYLLIMITVLFGEFNQNSFIYFQF